jgi:drug/metabolite transporter (DMT)-like permease
MDAVRSGARQVQVVVAFAAVYLVWGSTYLAIHFGIETLPPFLMAGTRFLAAGAILYGFARLVGARRPTRATWWTTGLTGVLLLGGNGGVVWAQQRVPSGMTALLVATVPLWMVLLDWAVERRRPTARVWAGLAVGFLGLALLIGPADFLGGGAADPLGAAVLICASLSWATGSVVSRRVALPASPLLGTGMQMLAAGAVLLAFGSLAGEWPRLELAGVSTRSWLALAYLVVFGSLVGFTAYTWLLRNVEIAKVATYAYVNPVVAVLLGWMFAGEALTPRMGLAAGVIVAAVAFITSARARPAAAVLRPGPLGDRPALPAPVPARPRALSAD